MNQLEAILQEYTVGALIESELLASGLIHETHLLTTTEGRYILQKLHPLVGSPAVAEDMEKVTRHLTTKGVRSPHIVKTKVGGLVVERAGSIWRLQTALEGHSEEVITSPNMAEEAGKCLGRFHAAMQDCDEPFTASIRLHRTEEVLQKCKAVIEQNRDTEKSKEAAEEIALIQNTLPTLLLPAHLPVRVIHGDPKISNFLFLQNKAVALIDLDTCQRHTPLVDLGDALRSWCGRKEDDAQNTFSMKIFEAGLQGYRTETETFMSKEEWELIPQAVALITLELAARFLTDYFKDSYFGWDKERYQSRTAHNLARAKGQIALYRSFIAQK